MQGLLVLVAAGLLVFAGFSLGRAAGYEAARSADEFDLPPKAATTQAVVLGILGLGALAGALALQTDAGVRLLTPARLEQLEKGPEPGSP